MVACRADHVGIGAGTGAAGAATVVHPAASAAVAATPNPALAVLGAVIILISLLSALRLNSGVMFENRA